MNPHPCPSPMTPDEHDLRWLSHVKPAGWINPRPPGRYNLVVIGAGTAGLVTAVGAAGLGARVALVERHLLGGDCLNVGCVPSKGLLRAARAAAEVRDAAEFGTRIEGRARTDFSAAMGRVHRLRADIAPHDSASRLQSLGVDVYLGQARFTAGDTVEVGGQELRFSRACIATGARASAPSIEGIARLDYLTNENVFDLTELPPRLAVIGAGPIGCEMAQAFARLGSQVHLIEAMHGVLPKDDPQAGQIVLAAMERDGVRLMCCGKDLRVERAGDGARLRVDSHGHHYDLTVDRVLVAVGRAPNIEGLNLEAAGVKYDTKKGVKVDDRLRTTHPHIFAAGDICSEFQFTHTADAQARIVIRNALFPFLPGKAVASDLIVPWCTYTSPEVAHVGLYPQEAEKRGLKTQTLRVDLAEVDRAVLDAAAQGFLKVYLRRGSDRIVGATLVSQHAGETISQITAAMVHGIGLGKLAGVIYPYPTQAECIKKAADAYQRTRLTPFAKKLFAKLMAWQR